MKRVDPSVYTTRYYLTDCNGYQEFKRSWGVELEPLARHLVSLIPVRPGQQFLDIGCGRGELVFWAARRGAHVWGIDYSPAAIKLAKTASKKQPLHIRNRCHFQVADAKTLKFPDTYFDTITSLEVLEHLYPEEQDAVLSEISRVLKPDGFIFIHTAPGRIFNDFTYRYYCYPVSVFFVTLWNFLFHKNYPHLTPVSGIRTSSHKIMHVGEPDYFSLKKLFFRHGLIGQIKSTNLTIAKPEISWKDRIFNLLVYLTPLSNRPPLNILFGNDFYSLLHKN